MKKTKRYALLLGCLIVASCSGKHPQEKAYTTYEDLETEFRSSLTSQDTAEVMGSATALMEGLRKGELEASLRKLFMVENGQVVPLEGSKLDALANRFKHFPVVSYKLDYYCFSVEQLNDIKYVIETAGEKESGKAPIMAFMLNPMKINGKWFLCVKDRGQASKDVLNPIDPRTIIGRR